MKRAAIVATLLVAALGCLGGSASGRGIDRQACFSPKAGRFVDCIIRPKTIDLGFSSGRVSTLKWRDWGSPRPVAIGHFGSGTVARVELSGGLRCGQRLWYSRITVTYRDEGRVVPYLNARPRSTFCSRADPTQTYGLPSISEREAHYQLENRLRRYPSWQFRDGGAIACAGGRVTRSRWRCLLQWHRGGRCFRGRGTVKGAYFKNGIAFYRGGFRARIRRC